jgi:hypothetical protein
MLSDWDQHVAETFLLFLSEMKCNEHRLQALYMVQEAVCFHCGRMVTEETACHCWKDE